MLKFPFIRKAKKNSYLVDLIEKYKRWKAAGGGQSDSDSEASDSYVMLTRVSYLWFSPTKFFNRDESKGTSSVDSLIWDLTIRPQHNPGAVNKLYAEEIKPNEEEEIVLTREINKVAVSNKNTQQNGDSKFVADKQTSPQYRNSTEKQVTVNEQSKQTSIVVSIVIPLCDFICKL